MTFFNKALGVPGPVAPRAPYVAPAPQYQGQLPAAPVPQQAWQQLAVDTSATSAVDEVASTIREQGYYKKAPQWIKSQPDTRCPQCNSAQFVMSGEGEGTAGRLLQSRNKKGGVYEYGRCFDCGYTLNGRGQSDAQIGNATSHAINSRASVVETRQSHGLGQNFYTIQGSI